MLCVLCALCGFVSAIRNTMGLYEKARNLVDTQLPALLEPGTPVPEDELRRYILEVDGYRRTLAKSLSQKANEEANLRRQTAERSAQLALWRARVVLARERGREDLAVEALARAAKEQAEREAIERDRELLAAAIANLTVSVEKLARTLQLLHEKRRAQAGGAVPERAPARNVAPLEAAPGREVDAVEEAFLRLELDEVTRQFDRRKP